MSLMVIHQAHIFVSESDDDDDFSRNITFCLAKLGIVRHNKGRMEGIFMNHNGKENVYLSKYFAGRPYGEYPFKVDFSVLFTNVEKNISKQLIDSDGNIPHFPGVEFTDVMKAELGRDSLEPRVKYEVIFEKLDDGRLIMVWTVRPDGRYWMDSWGFGAEDDEALSVYAYIDSEGNFMMPFKLYSIGYTFYGDYRLKRE